MENLKFRSLNEYLLYMAHHLDNAIENYDGCDLDTVPAREVDDMVMSIKGLCDLYDCIDGGLLIEIKEKLSKLAIIFNIYEDK